ncbi:unnamed protein product [Cochlearia groenlandica]
MRVASERNVDRLQRVDDYRHQRDEARATAAEQETKVALMLKRAEIAEDKNSRFEGELIAAENTRKDVKGIGASVVNRVKDHLSLLKARFPIEREIVEIKANQDFLVGIQKGEYPDFNVEAANMNEDLLAVKGKLAAMPIPSLESPPPSEEIESEMALVHVDVKAAGGSAPLAAVPPIPTSFDQFGSMTANLSVEDALSLRESDTPEELGTRIDGDQASAEGGQEIVPIEGETTPPGPGPSEEVEVNSQT